MYCLATMKAGIWSREDSCEMSKAGTGICLSEQTVLEADFADRFRTARGLGFGFDDLSRKASRIPRKVRKKITATVVEVMKIRCLIMSVLSFENSINTNLNSCQLYTADQMKQDNTKKPLQEGLFTFDYFPRRELLNTGFGAPPAAPGRLCCGRPAGLLSGWSFLNGLIEATGFFFASAGLR